MQGGSADDLPRLRHAVDSVKCCDARAVGGESPKDRHEAQSPIDTLTVVSEICVSPEIDACLERAREWFAWTLATPIAWLHGDISVTACRDRKQQRVRDGSSVVVAIQRRCRTPWADFYFSFWSFFAEEEFYLLSLPILFWNVDYRFARQVTLVVCFGLLWGNILKDVFRLPRPANVEPKVWVPHSASQIDSTACRDFGFPSTHAMNSVSNSLFWVLYSIQYGMAGKPMNYWILFVGAFVWITSITFGRLYLGVHSPMDVKGGLLLGLTLAFICQRPLSLCDHLDKWILTAPHVGILLFLWSVVVLTLNPQPRPMTPTFMQNCVLNGLIWGCIVGFRNETDRRLGRGILGWSVPASENGLSHVGSNDHGWALLLFRTTIGYTIVMLVRTVLKKVLVTLCHKAGFEPEPSKNTPKGDKQDDVKAWDLCAAAVVKTAVYAALAWSITCACPAFFEVIGLPSEMNG